MKFKLLILASLLTLSGCANLQPRINEVSLESYERGCALRGIQRGMSSSIAQAVCRCHIDKAVKASSKSEFLATTEKIGNASKEERASKELKAAMSLMKETFQSCKNEITASTP